MNLILNLVRIDLPSRKGLHIIGFFLENRCLLNPFCGWFYLVNSLQLNRNTIKQLDEKTWAKCIVLVTENQWEIKCISVLPPVSFFCSNRRNWWIMNYLVYPVYTWAMECELIVTITAIYTNRFSFWCFETEWKNSANELVISCVLNWITKEIQQVVKSPTILESYLQKYIILVEM